MNIKDLSVVLGKVGVDPKYCVPTRPGQLIVPCPLAKWTHKSGTDNHPSCSVKFGDPASPTLYHCFACKESGKLWDLVHSVGEFSNDEGLRQLGLKLLEQDEPTLMAKLEAATNEWDMWVLQPPKSVIRPLNESVLDGYPPTWGVPRGRTYLESRRVTESMAKFWDLRWHSHHSRIVFPVRDRKLQLVGAVGRAVFDEMQPKYYNMFGFATGLTLGGLHKATGQRRVGVCEGFFDLMNVWWWAQCCGVDMVCTFTAKTTKEQGAILQRMDANLIYFYDWDEAGNKGWEDAQKMLGPVVFGLRRAWWPDVNKDVGDFVCQEEFTRSLT